MIVFFNNYYDRVGTKTAILKFIIIKQNVIFLGDEFFEKFMKYSKQHVGSVLGIIRPEGKNLKC